MRIAADSHLIFQNGKSIISSFSVITTFFETEDLLIIKIGCKGTILL